MPSRLDSDRHRFAYNVSMDAPIEKASGVFEHNVANGIGQLHIEVVADAPN